MNIYEELGIKTYINAHDTYTIYGGSRMSETALRGMAEISKVFVDINELQRTLGEKIAQLTNNEAAYVTNGASGGLLLATAVCLSEGDPFQFMRLPESSGKKEVIIMNCQHNAYDKAIHAAGAQIMMIGDADETQEVELKGTINENTAAVFYFMNVQYDRAALPLANVIEIAHAQNVPVIVDAAAQLPPVENLWNITATGADLAIFSGGKTLCGPQDSGLIVGRKDLIEDCIRFGAPAHGVCRSSKVSREAMVGFYVALKEYLSLDHVKNNQRLLNINLDIKQALEKIGIKAKIVDKGPVGQAYPRLFAFLDPSICARKVEEKMRRNGIYIGCNEAENAIYISPLNLNDEEVQIVKKALISSITGSYINE